MFLYKLNLIAVLDTLITNKTRLKLLIRFFLNPGASSYLRGLEEEFGESTNAIRVELNRFEAAGLLVSWGEKNRKMFSANRNHPLFNDIHSILVKHTGIDSIISNVIDKLGHVESAYVKGVMERSPAVAPVDLYIFGEPADQQHLLSLTSKAATLIKRNINCTILPGRDEKTFLETNQDVLLVWKK